MSSSTSTSVTQSGKHGGNASGDAFSGSTGLAGSGAGAGSAAAGSSGWGYGGSSANASGSGIGGGAGSGADAFGAAGGDVSDNTSIGSITINS